MALKRSATDTDPSAGSRRRLSKRTKISPPEVQRSSSGERSICSVSEDSALQSSRAGCEHDSSITSRGESPEDGLNNSSSESSASDAVGSEEGEEQIVTIGGPAKPNITGAFATDGARDLQTRLTALLPQLADANQALASGGGSHSMEDVEEDDPHIELNLGLGVLEQREDDETSSTSADSSDEISSEGEDSAFSSGGVQKPSEDTKPGRLDKLMGHREARPRGNIGIEDIG